MKRIQTLYERKGLMRALLFVLFAFAGVQSYAQCSLNPTVGGVATSIISPATHTIQLLPGECCSDADVIFALSNVGCAGCTANDVTITFPDGSGRFISSVDRVTDECWPIGTTHIVFKYADCANTGVLEYTLDLTVNEFQRTTTSIACNDRVQVSLDGSCSATVTADLVLQGKNYGCYDKFEVTVEDKFGNTIDRDPVTPGVQIDGSDLGNCYTTTIRDTTTGNSCWGKICIEDKLPPQLTCPNDTTVSCRDPHDLTGLNTPTVSDGCGYTLTYTDKVEDGSCALNYSARVKRTWIAKDATGNESTCVQIITVALGDLDSVMPPPSYDSRPGNKPMLMCDQRRNNNDYSSHYNNPAFSCGVDNYILDRDWANTHGGVRRPDTLGWNYIQSGKYAGHPSPDNVYYPAKPGCWGENEVVMWQGTGYPEGASCFNINYTFEDRKIDISDPGCDAGDVGCYKILRRWIVLDWCSSEVKEYNQIIKVVDTTGPTTVVPDEITLGTDVWKCSATFNVPDPDATDNCSKEVHYTVFSADGTLLGSEASGYIVADLGLGTHNVIIKTSDCCGNHTLDTIKVTVIDDKPPHPVCDKHTVVSLISGNGAGDNISKVYARTFDDGSYDNCNDSVWFKVIRMEDLKGTNDGSYTDNKESCDGANGDDDLARLGNQVYFDDYVKFCCEDGGKTIMVVFRVFDVNPGAGPVVPSRMTSGNLKGHFSDCMVEVEVQDKSIPTVVAPPDIVVTCMFWFDDSKESLEDVNNKTFGRLVKKVEDREPVTTHDKVCRFFCKPNDKTGYPVLSKACDFYNTLYNRNHPGRQYDLTWGRDGYAFGTCSLDCSIKVVDKRECGQGPIYRYFTVTANGKKFTDVQVIWVVDCDPFYISDNCTDPYDDIKWPLNCQDPEILEGCGAQTSPDNPALGRPVIDNGGDDNCSLISIDFEDKKYTIEADACYKILRDWVVVDWCQFDPRVDLDKDQDGQIDYWHPHPGEWHYLQIIKVIDHNPPVVTVKIGDCEPAIKDSLWKCRGHINLSADADDKCTKNSWLKYEYKIDLNNDGTVDYNVGPAKPGDIPFVQNNPYADDSKDATNASGVYPTGWHRITWYVEDGCGNIGVKDTVFHVKDCKNPTPYCRSGIVTVVMPTTGAITVWATDLNIGSYDNCTEEQNLKFYFFGDPKWTGYVISCDTFKKYGVQGKYTTEVEMWVEDEEGNADFCRTTIEVQDPNNVCDGADSLAAIGGKLFTNDRRELSNTKVQLFNGGTMMKEGKSSGKGDYAFYNLPMNQDYSVKPLNNDNILNGVNTRDLVAIQRYLLGKMDISDPYTLIAADANNSGSVSTGDIAVIRKVILGKSKAFKGVNSWRFVPANYLFADPRDPWQSAFPEEIKYEKLNRQMMNTNFVSIKVGDLTGDAKTNGLKGSSTRTSKMTSLVVADQAVQAGQEVIVPVTSTSLNGVEGFQFTMHYDPTAVEFVQMRSGAIQVSSDNYAVFADRGVITMSWHDISSISVDDQTALFSFVFKGKAKSTLSEMLYIDSDITPALAFDNDNTYGVIMRFAGQERGEGYVLYQNTPNPFDGKTTIGFELPEDMDASISVYNMSGKLLKVAFVSGQKGYNEVVFKAADFGAESVLYYQLNAGSFISTKKMVIMK